MDGCLICGSGPFLSSSIRLMESKMVDAIALHRPDGYVCAAAVLKLPSGFWPVSVTACLPA